VSRSPDAPERTADPGSKSDLRARLANLLLGHPSGAGYPDRRPTDGAWNSAKAKFAEAWQRHEDRWPHPEEKAKRAELSSSVERELADGCDKIQEAEQELTSRLLDIEAEQPGRSLVGLKFCVKGRERLLEKATEYMREMPGLTPAQALTLVPDSLRYTFGYHSDSYSDGVRADIDRLKHAGFEMIKLKNFWDDREYKGINTQWRDAGTGKRFEMQFHTTVSFEAKQLTHDAYERIREPANITSRRELRALHRLQRDVTKAIPVPPRAREIGEQA
jgi:hypothetical protein